MILITGGLGFIGLNTARAFLDIGESCVLTLHQVRREPSTIKDEIGKRIFIEKLDIFDKSALMQLGKQYKFTGIVHLGGAGFDVFHRDASEFFRLNMTGFLNVLEATKAWEVKRLSTASSVGIYGGIKDSVFREEQTLPISGANNPIEVSKKNEEQLGTFFSRNSGFQIVKLRISTWGPLGRNSSMFFPGPQMVHAAVKGELPDFKGNVPFAEDGFDVSYIKDTSRAIALLQTAKTLKYDTYNIGSGRPCRNKEILSAIRKVIPDFNVELREGYNPAGPGQATYMDISRLYQDIGFQPEYNIDTSVADYISWLKAGNER